MHLIQIVPGLFPQIDGIGDYALVLARRLREAFDIETRFMVCDPLWPGGDVEGFHVEAVAQRKPQAYRNTLQALMAGAPADTPVLLQFSPYGYEQRGVPIAFTGFLRQWDAADPGRLSMAFHELDNHTSNILSSTFWFTPLQRELVKRLARIGHYKYTNTSLYREKLESWGAGSVALLPNFSTLGEPDSYPAWNQRERKLVVFGRGVQRLQAYGRGLEALRTLCSALEITQIEDIGEPLGDLRALLPGVEIVSLGRLSASEVAARMSRAIGSFISYPVPLLTKSSIHAVSCACGAIPFIHNIDGYDAKCPLLEAGVDYIAVSPELDLTSLPLEAISRSVFDNYQQRHSIVAAKRLAAALRQGATDASGSDRII